MEKRYLVTWEIDIFANTPEEAAKQALRIQRDVLSQGLVFQVVEHGTADVRVIDLLDAGEE